MPFRHLIPPPANEISRKNKILLTLIITASTLASNYSLRETLYWLAGLPYFWCTSLHLLSMALAIKALRGSRAAFLSCVAVLFINGTLIELPCIFQGVVAFVAMVGFALRRDKKSALICCAFWLTSIAAFGFLYYASSTTARMAKHIPTGFQFFTAHLKRTLLIGAFGGVLTTIKFFATPLTYVFLLFLPLIAKKIPASQTRLKLWHVIVIVYLVAALMQAIHGWGLSGRLPERGDATALWCMGFTWCCLLGRYYRGKLTDSQGFANFARRWRYPFFILALLISFNFWDAVNELKTAPAYRAEHVARAKEIIVQRDAGVDDIVVTRFENKSKLLGSDLSYTPEEATFSKYYGIKRIMAIPKELSGDIEAINELRQGHLAPLIPLAEAGDADFLYNLGLHSEPFLQYTINAQTTLQHGLEVSLEQAEKYYRMGIAAGDSNCMWTLARVIYTKDKSFKSLSEALYWMLNYQIHKLRL